MFELFYLGGALFMGILTTILLVAVSFSIYQAVRISTGKLKEAESERHLFSYIKSFGLFALITGLLGQLIGLMSAFESIEQMGSVSQDMLAGGLRISSITSLYGLLIFLITYILWFALDYWRTREQS